MKFIPLWILLLFAAAAQALTLVAPAPQPLAPLPQQAQVGRLIIEILQRYEYKTTAWDNALSERIFDRYLLALDPGRLYFLQTDIDAFASARGTLGAAVAHGNLQAPYAIFNVYQRRVAERLSYARELLKRDFTFEQHESYQYERAKEPWAKSEDELRDLWRRRVKNDWLTLKLAGKENTAIRAMLDARYSNSLARAYKFKSEDVFQVFMDSYATSVDPHTDYLGLRAAQEFDIEMRLSLVGVGAVIQQRDEYLTIRELVPGGPAALSAKLNIGDRLVAVGQGGAGPMTDVIGWRIDDVVALVRGAKGSLVRLDVLPAAAGPDGKPKRITLVRNKVNFEEQAAKKSLIRVKDGAKTRLVGVISLPTFYQDVDARGKGEKDFKSATRDVARLLDELKEDKVDAVLVDLRNDGGGLLDEAVQLTGLFIGKGPVVQERNSQGNVRVDSVDDKTPAWNGPLCVLINRGSASAAEIFAAAIQDYGRGIIIGEPSFGKGTVQSIVDLDQIAHNDKPKFGELKMTIAQFFRVNGDSTQLRGVTPDIPFPAVVAADADTVRESSFDNALPWAHIKGAAYAPAANLAGLLPQLKGRDVLRVAQDKDFQSLLAANSVSKLQRGAHAISLNEADRRKERGQREAQVHAQGSGKQKKTTKAEAAASNMTAKQDSGLIDELAEEKAQKNAKDVWLNESAHILSDQVGLLGLRKANAKVAPVAQ